MIAPLEVFKMCSELFFYKIHTLAELDKIVTSCSFYGAIKFISTISNAKYLSN
jgi:hypothetical protein